MWSTLRPGPRRSPPCWNSCPGPTRFVVWTSYSKVFVNIWATKVTLLTAAPDSPYCSGELILRTLVIWPSALLWNAWINPPLTLKCNLTLCFNTQIVAALLLRALRSNSGESLQYRKSFHVEENSPACISLYFRSYIDSAKKLGQKFDLVIDDGRARVGVSLKWESRCWQIL